jgi:hypothetical protein
MTLSAVAVATAASAHPRRTARDREARRIRILGMFQGGFPYDVIARHENLSRERVRQIVAKSLEENGRSRLDHSLVQLARLEPALQLAARRVAEGDLRGVDRLVRVLDRIDKYGQKVRQEAESSAEIHERLMAKINNALQRRDREPAELAAEKAELASAPAGTVEAAEVAADPKNLENASIAPKAFSWP